MAKEFTPEELAAANKLLQGLFTDILKQLAPALKAINDALVAANLIDTDGNLTDNSKELLKEIKRNENNT